VEHTEEWALIEPLLPWHEQREYELLRPIVLFGDTPAERAGQTGAAARTLHEKARRFDEEGDEMLRRLLVGSAHYILGPFASDSDLRRHGEKIASRGGKNSKKRAAVAVARKLSVLLHRLWVTAEVYDPLYNACRRTKQEEAA
jgi:hypothetical protein